MDQKRIVWHIYFCSIILYLLCIHALNVSTTLFQNVASSAPTDETKYRMAKERNIMLVLPVMQGSDDPSDPRLQFWYTKPPVTVVVEEDDKKEEKFKQPSTASTSSTQRYTEADMMTFDIVTTNSPQTDYDNSETKLDSDNSPITLSPYKRTQTLVNQSNNWLSNHQDVHVTFVKNKMEYSPSPPSTSQPTLQIISAEPKWKSDIHKLIEYDKLKFQKPKPRPEISTVLPSSTRIQFYSDFIPIETGQRKPSLQKITFEKTTTKPPRPEPGFSVAQRDTQYDSLKVYDMMKIGSLKPMSSSKHDDAEYISSSDREFFDVLREMSIPTDSLFKERTKSAISVKTPSSKATDQWVFTYGPEELSTLPIEVTYATVTEENPSSTSQKPLMTLLPPTTLDSTLANDFKKMLIALGILRDNKTMTTTESNELWVDPDSFTTDPLSYSKFKKIPIVEELPPIRKDMQSLLNSFGLLPQIDDTANFTPIRVTRQSKDLGSHRRTEESKMNVHTIFSEGKTPISKKKTNSKKSTKILNTPLSLLRGFNNRSNRRNPLFTVFTPLKKTRKVSHPKRSKKKTIPRSTTTKPKRADNSSVSYEDLADSFGGGETAKNDTSDENLTTTPNGLYFLVDWNWFLKTGDDDDKRPIRLKFSPHVGDPKRFIPIDFP